MRRVHSFLLVAVLLSIFPAVAMALEVAEIMARVDARDDGDNATSVMEMVLIDKNGHQRSRTLQSFTKDRGNDTQRLMFFLAPGDVRGTGFLTYDYGAANRDDDQWMYLPELHKTKRIAASDKSGSFMGSDFSFADMTRRVLSEWNYQMLREEVVRGKKTWLIEATPANRAVRDRYGYDKSVVFVQQDNFMVVRAVHWLRDGRLKYLDVKKMLRVSGIWVGTEIEMRTVRDNQIEHRTILRFRDVKFDRNLSDELFSIRRLEQGP